ncbi:MAG: low molecular weight phosphotyrosine protein phosphatase [Nitrospira sp.]|nr:low molecular weight phosphotyrosine protein phosphatase [Nitrospira sp.]
MVVASQIKKSLVDLYWMVRGTSLHVPALPSQPRSVLFVCKGNICRSPFAEHVARKLFHERVGDTDQPIVFQSAGLHVTVPKAPPDTALVVARQFGVCLDAHRSQPVSPKLVADSDVIVAMEGWHYDELRSRFKGYEEKIVLLSLFSRNTSSRFGYDAFNIQDPYGGSERIFEECFEKIEQCVKALLIELGAQKAAPCRL